MTKFLAIIFLFILAFTVMPVRAANTPPPGTNGQFIINSNNQWGAISAGSPYFTNLRGVPSNQWTSLNIFGDASSFNDQFVPLTNGYGALVAEQMGAGPTYHVVNDFGHFDCDVVDQEIVPNVNPTQSNNGLLVWLPTPQEVTFGAGNYAAHLIDDNTCHLGGLTWAAIARSNKVYGQQFTASGTWTNSAHYTIPTGIVSNTQGDTASGTITTNGGPIYLWFLMHGNDGGTFTWQLDSGAVSSNVATQGQNAFSFPISGKFSLGAVRIPVATAGSHTVNIIVTSATSGSNTVTIEGIGTPAVKAYSAKSPVIVFGGQIPSSTYVQASIDFNNAYREQTVQLTGDYLAVPFADVQAYWNAATDFLPAGSINSTGQLHISQAFNGVIQASRNSMNAINPMDYGASCNSIHFDGGYTVKTTAGSPIISIANYTFQPGVATQSGGGDVGKKICIFSLSQSNTCTISPDVGPCTYISSVNTSNNTATLGANMAATTYNCSPACSNCVAGPNALATMGGYPANPADPSTARDDTIPIQISGNAAILNGGKVFLPTNCMGADVLLPSNIVIEGNSASQYYQQGSQAPDATPPQATIFNCALTGYPDAPQTCFQQVPYTMFKNFLIRGPGFPYTPVGLSSAAIGYTTNSRSGPGAQILTDNMSYYGNPINVGQAYGYNHDVNFTASITDNGDGTSTMNVTSIDSTNFKTADNWSSHDFLALGRPVSGPGVTAGTVITFVPPTSLNNGENLGNYILNKAMNVTSTGLTSTHNTSLMELRDNHSQHIWYGIAYNGDFSDSIINSSVCTGTFAQQCWRLGPLVAGSGNGGNRWIGGRMEEQGVAGITCDSCGVTITGLDQDFNGGNNIRTLGSGDVVQWTGGNMDAGGHYAGFFNTMISLGGTNPVVSIDGVRLSTTDYANGGSTTYLFRTATGASGVQASITGGETSVPGNTVNGLYDWTNGAPSKYKQFTAGWPLIDNTQSILSSTTSGNVGIGTAAARDGMALDMLSNTTTLDSSFGFPSGTTANRPTTPLAGMGRFNTTNLNFEGYNGTTWGSLAGALPVIDNYIGGFVLSNDLASPNNTIDIGPGTVASDDNSIMMTQSSAITKTTSAWSLGSGGGCLDSGSIAASTWYNDFAIERTDTLVVDNLCSTSAISPALPASYTVQRRLNCGFQTDGSANILPFSSKGDNCVYGSSMQTLDLSTALADTASHLVTINVPLGVEVRPFGSYTISANAVSMTSPGVSALAPTTTNPFTATPGFNLFVATTTGNENTNYPYIITDSAQHVRLWATAATTTVSGITAGFTELHEPLHGNLALDGTATGTSTSQTGTFSLSTTQPHEPIFVFFSSTGNDAITGTTIQGVTDGAGITLSLRKRQTYRSNTRNLELWYGVAPAVLTSDTFTWTATSASHYNVAASAFAVRGANATTIFDPNVSLPASASNTPSGTTVTTTISTTHGNDMVIAGSTGTCSGQTIPSGFANITSTFDSYELFSVPQTNLAVSYTYASCFDNALITDAIVGAGP